MGLVFGPVSYIAGAKLGAADFDYSTAHILALAVIWMVVLPALVRVARQMQVRTDQATSGDDENGGGV
jgi:hypothetical protein